MDASKKKNAIMLADTRSWLIGHVLLQLQKTNKGVFNEALIYHTSLMSEKDKQLLNSIMPCRFIQYHAPLSDHVKHLERFKVFSELMFARYEMFGYLNEFETVTWIDTDVLIQKSLAPVLSMARKNGMAANFEDPKNHSAQKPDRMHSCFITSPEEYDCSRYNMSSGLICISDRLKNHKNYTDWLYKATEEYASVLMLPDQGVLNMFIQHFGIKAACVGGTYCAYPYYQRDTAGEAVVHAWGQRKFWNNWYLYNKYPEWRTIYDQWVTMGGSRMEQNPQPLVSVVIPCYRPNIAYFKRCLDNLLKEQQDIHSLAYDNFELIIVIEPVDFEPVQALAESYHDPRIVFCVNPERYGIAKSLNVGLRKAKGTFIARMDDDDIAAPLRLYRQATYLQQHSDVSLCTSDFEYFGDMNEYRVTFEGEMSRAWSIFTCPFDHPTVMFRRDFFAQNDLFYDETRGFVEDWELWLRAYRKGMVVGCIHDALLYHRWHSGTASQNEGSIKMMRALVQKNFAELGLTLSERDLLLVSPWNGRLLEQADIDRLQEIFEQAIQCNQQLHVYDPASLQKAFDLRIAEACNGQIPEIVLPSKSSQEAPKGVQKPAASLRSGIKQKLKGALKNVLKPLYSPIKRRFQIPIYNIEDRVNGIDQRLQALDQNRLENIQHELNNVENKLSQMQNGLGQMQNGLGQMQNEVELQKRISRTSLKTHKKCFLLGTSDHSNIGDAAIAVGALEFLRRYFPEYMPFEISTYEIGTRYSELCALCNPDDLIFLQGGGNLGNRFMNEENLRRKVIADFPNNHIVILPQTIYFDDDAEVAASGEIYARHKNLQLFTRGRESLTFAQKHFPQLPSASALDMALILQRDYCLKRQGILLCIRDLTDESGLTKEEYLGVIQTVADCDPAFEKTNNLYATDIPRQEREFVVYEELKRFARHRVVVTDRLHGLIFSIVTQTPCVVLSAFNQKIREFSADFSNSNAVFFLDRKLDEIADAVQKAIEVEHPQYPILTENVFANIAAEVRKKGN